MSEDDNKKPTAFLDTLSQIMKVLKNSISLLQKLSTLCIKQLQISQTKSQIDNLKTILITISQNDNQFQEDTIKYLFFRLAGRLRQILQVSQNQYIYSLTHSSIKNYIKQAFSLIQIFQGDKNLSKLCKKLAYLISRYSVQIPFSLNRNTSDKSKMEMIGTHFLQKKQTPKKQKVDNQSNLMRMFQIINKRYNLLTGMSIDYNHFRSTLLQTKNQQHNIYSDCFQRNKLIFNKMQQYAKNHINYLNKKTNLKRKKSLKENRSLKTECQKQQYIQGNSVFYKRNIKTKSNLSNLIFQKTRFKNTINININPEQKILLDTSIINITSLKKQNNSIDEKICIWKSKRQNFKYKDTLQMTNVLMTGNYFDSQSSKQEFSTKNNFYRKKLSYIINRGFDYSQNGFAKSQKLKHNLSQS